MKTTTLTGKKIVIIGGSSGIGFATAKACVEQGAFVVIVGRRKTKLAQAKKLLGGTVETAVLDVTKEKDVAKFFKHTGKMDHLLVPGSAPVMGDFLSLSVKSAKAGFESKFWGQYMAARYGAPLIKKGGSITLFSGTLAQRPKKGAVTLSAINTAVEGLGRALALELAPIRVNVVAPGLVDTPIFDGMNAADRKRMYDQHKRGIPVGHVGQPEEIAHSLLFLMQNTYTTGHVLYVDGGHLLR